MWYRIPVSGHHNGHQLTAAFVHAESVLEAGQKLIDAVDMDPSVRDLEIMPDELTVVDRPPELTGTQEILFEEDLLH